MTLYNGQGIKYSASNIRTDPNLCVIRDNGGKRQKNKCSGKKKKKKFKKQCIFSGDITFLLTKQASVTFMEKTDLVSSVQLALISLIKSHHIYDLLFINSQED